jgi:sterol desaturase/sphingolipid hydroxylase (fatty acid hydroxylase superfamily)
MGSVIETLINKWALSTVVVVGAAMLISQPERVWWSAIGGIFFMHIWVYWIHRGLHLLPRNGIIGLLNTHIRFHHAGADVKPLPRWLELCVETVTDLGMNLSLLALQYAAGLHIVPTSCIVFFAVAYTSVHLINYSLVGSDSHRLHHSSMERNFGPEPMDHWCGTNYDSTAEDLSPMALNAIFAYYVTRLLKTQIGWVD